VCLSQHFSTIPAAHPPRPPAPSSQEKDAKLAEIKTLSDKLKQYDESVTALKKGTFRYTLIFFSSSTHRPPSPLAFCRTGSSLSHAVRGPAAHQV
jgi:hypothetical protein